MALHEMGVQPTLAKPTRMSKSELVRRVSEFEFNHEMSSVEFVKRWRSGELPEQSELIEWYRLSAILDSLA